MMQQISTLKSANIKKKVSAVQCYEPDILSSAHLAKHKGIKCRIPWWAEERGWSSVLSTFTQAFLKRLYASANVTMN
jgi:hypothetical protein